MNIDNRATKVYLKSLAPVEAIDLVNKYLIPSPQKECLIAMINGKDYKDKYYEDKRGLPYLTGTSPTYGG